MNDTTQEGRRRVSPSPSQTRLLLELGLNSKMVPRYPTAGTPKDQADGDMCVDPTVTRMPV